MKKVVALICALLLAAALFAGCSTSGKDTGEPSSAPASMPAGTPTENIPTSGETPAPPSDASGDPSSASSEPFSVDAAFGGPEDPSFAETVMTIGTFELPLAIYRYYYLSLRESLLAADPEALTGENAVQNKEELNVRTMGYCRAMGAYFTLAKQLGINEPASFEEGMTAYLRQISANLTAYGMTFSDYYGPYMTKTVFRAFYALNSYAADQVKAALMDREISPADFSEDAIAAAQEDARTVKHILVGYSDGKSDEDALALANDLIARIKNGEDFDALQKEYSNDYHEGQSNIYTFTHGTMVEEFDEASFALAVNELSEPVKTQFGYHVILRLPLDEKAFADELYPQMAADAYLNALHGSIEITPSERYPNPEAAALATLPEAA